MSYSVLTLSKSTVSVFISNILELNITASNIVHIHILGINMHKQQKKSTLNLFFFVHHTKQSSSCGSRSHRCTCTSGSTIEGVQRVYLFNSNPSPGHDNSCHFIIQCCAIGSQIRRMFKYVRVGPCEV